MNQVQQFKYSVSREEIASTYEPFVHKRLNPGSAEWKRITSPIRNKVLLRYWKERIKGVIGDDALFRYWRRLPLSWQSYHRSLTYKELPDFRERLSTEGPVVPHVWGDEGMLARDMGPKRVHQLLLIRAIEGIQPDTVLEVGCGTGINLLVFGGCFPRIKFAGIDLAENCVRTVHNICKMPTLAEEIVDFSPAPIIDKTAYRRLEVLQGTAKELPFPDKSFDVIYTIQALERMEEIRHEALRELARVARRYVIMLEPFQGFNSTGIRYYHHEGNKYFGTVLADLPQDGLEPLMVYSDFPREITLWPALVIARPI
ncbi:class I SAM-dependent methyltransferase [bacterium AH-315-O15]|nr:class I SAM-dependent methyltransferase [bacterium AH-315-O15]